MLTDQLKQAFIDIVGEERLLDSQEELACFSYDSYVEQAMPEAVLFPVSTQEVSDILKTASAHGTPVTGRGAGTSVCGAPIPVKQGIVLCFSKMNRIIEINTADRYVIVEPGVVNMNIQKALAPHGFFYPPDPGSMTSSTIGGNIAQNAGGPRCLKYGVTADYILGLEVVLASGKVIEFGSRNVKDVTGYRLSSLFCGSEGTLGMVTRAILKVVPLPETQKTMMVSFSQLDDSARSVSAIIGSGIIPAAMELLDNPTINAIEDISHAGLPREAAGVLIIEVDGPQASCDNDMQRIVGIVEDNGALSVKVARTSAERESIWGARRMSYAAFASLAPDITSEDVTVPVSKVPEMIRAIIAIADKYNLKVGVAAHAGDGNMHPMIPADRQNKEEWQRVEKAYAEMFEKAVQLGGTLSGEHGIGLAKAEHLPLVMNPDTLEFMSVIKKTVDPDNILNPGKFV